MKIPQTLIQTLQTAVSLTVLTGAGTSAESGVPTFREAQTGLWAQYDPQQLATPQAFRRNPQLVWEWYAWRRQLVAQAKPNAGHVAIAEMPSHFANFTLITQNVDGLHQEAGSQKVIELHGNIRRTICSKDGRFIPTLPQTDQAPPPCPHCGAPLRPDVVWFGESLPQKALAKAVRASETADCFLSIGTSALVHPAASLPLLALENGATLIEINPNPTPLTPHTHFHLPYPSGEALPALLKTLQT